MQRMLGGRGNTRSPITTGWNFSLLSLYCQLDSRHRFAFNARAGTGQYKLVPP